MRENPLNLEPLNQDKNIPEFPNQNLRQIGQGFMSYDRACKQTNRDYYFIYKGEGEFDQFEYIWESCLHFFKESERNFAYGYR